MGHQELYHPRGRIERTYLRSLLVLAIFGQVCGAPFSSIGGLTSAVGSCLYNVPSGNECCSSGLANCGEAGTDDMPEWDVSKIRNMGSLFAGAHLFNQDISRWDVSQVESMDNMFYGAHLFNQDISRWDVSQVESMDNMFYGASAFDVDITNWNTSSLLSAEHMFWDATAWNAKYEMTFLSCIYRLAFTLKGLNITAEERADKINDECIRFAFILGPRGFQRKDLPPTPSPPAYDPPTTSVGVGTVVLVAVIVLVIGFVSGYLVRLMRSKKGVPILDEDPDEENFERAPLST
jgi:hypothetical protein